MIRRKAHIPPIRGAANGARRVDDPATERTLIEAAMRSYFGPEKRLDMERFERTWREDPNTHIFVDTTNGKFIQADVRGHVQMVWWVPLAVTLPAEFLLCTPVMAETLRYLVANGVSTNAIAWGHFREESIVDGLVARLGPRLVKEHGLEGPPELPKVDNCWRGRITVGQLQTAIGGLV